MILRPLLFACLPLAAGPTLARTVEFDCVVEPAQVLEIGSSTTGLLAEVLVERGSHVSRGQVLARLDSRVQAATLALTREQASARQAREVAETRLRLAEAQVERSRRLAASGTGSGSQLEQDEAAFEIARHQLDAEDYALRLAAMEVERQQALLDQLGVTSPIDGIVTELHLHAGEFVRQDSPILRLAQIEPLHVESWLPVGLWGGLTPQTPATVRLTQPEASEVEARITVIDKVLDAASGTFGLRLELANPGDSIPAGQRCLLRLEIAEDGEG